MCQVLFRSHSLTRLVVAAAKTLGSLFPCRSTISLTQSILVPFTCDGSEFHCHVSQISIECDPNHFVTTYLSREPSNRACNTRSVLQCYIVTQGLPSFVELFPILLEGPDICTISFTLVVSSLLCSQFKYIVDIECLHFFGKVQYKKDIIRRD